MIDEEEIVEIYVPFDVNDWVSVPKRLEDKFLAMLKKKAGDGKPTLKDIESVINGFSKSLLAAMKERDAQIVGMMPKEVTMPDLGPVFEQLNESLSTRIMNAITNGNTQILRSMPKFKMPEMPKSPAPPKKIVSKVKKRDFAGLIEVMEHTIVR